MSHRIQIPKALYNDMVRFIVEAGPEAVTDPDLYSNIMDGIQAKEEAQTARRLYTASKTAHDAKTREAARIAYLDAKGVPASFRTNRKDDLP